MLEFTGLSQHGPACTACIADVANRTGLHDLRLSAIANEQAYARATAAAIAITSALNAAIASATLCLYCAVALAITAAIAATAKNTAPSWLGLVSIL
jgi:hypothetical protein